MEDFDLLKVINKLLPFLIFAGWAFVSVLAKGRKKPSPPPVAKKTPQKPLQQSPAKKSAKSPTITVMGELRKTLQTVFEEMRAPQERNEPDVEFGDSPSVARSSQKTKKNTPEPEIEVSQPETIIDSNYRRPYQNAYAHSEDDVADTVSRKTLRRGIVWAEILSPPVSLRE